MAEIAPQERRLYIVHRPSHCRFHHLYRFSDCAVNSVVHSYSFRAKNRDRREGRVRPVTPTLAHACPRRAVSFSSGDSHVKAD
jgi:hypothetical protein